MSMTSPFTVFDSARSETPSAATMATAASEASTLRMIQSSKLRGSAGADYTAFMERRNISSGTAWEPIVGCSRAVGLGDPAAQTKQVLQNIAAAREKAGARMEDVGRTRIYVTDISQWEPIGRA